MRHLLVTTDLSEASTAAFSVAREQAQALGSQECRVTLLHVCEDITAATFHYGLGTDVQNILHDLESSAQQELDKIRDRFFSGMPVMTTVIRAHKPVAREIVDFAHTHHVTTIILSSHGRSGFDHFLNGSVAERILRLSECPVLVLPAGRRIST
ncbi:MAG: universal stress protein [Bdellovibrionales bacterium]|nr:universal stress protein [Bdellovibrionales bacterium]